MSDQPDYGKHTSDLLPSENDVAPVEEPVVVPVPDGDTTPETPPKGDTTEDTPAVGEETPPEPSTFQKLGLDKTYATEDDAFNALVEKEKTITRHQMERQNHDDRISRLESRPAPQPTVTHQAEVSAEDFENDPQGSLDKLGYVKKDDVYGVAGMVTNDALDRRDAQEFAASKPDFEELSPVMNRIGSQTQGLNHMSRKAATEYLYMKAQEITGRTQLTPKPTVVTPAPGANNKPNANTSGGKGGGGGGKKPTGLDQYTPEQFEKLSLDEQRKSLGYG